MESLECQICKCTIVDLQQKACLTEKGCQRVNKASEERGDSIDVKTGQYVHLSCRKIYINSHYISKHTTNKEENTKCKPTLRSEKLPFSYTTDCLFCGNIAVTDERTYVLVYPVRTTDFDKTITSICDTRNDSWGEQVKSRISSCPATDLHAAGALYHNVCSVNFRTSRAIPKRHITEDTPECSAAKKKKPGGRPVDTAAHTIFLQVVAFWKENDEEQLTISDLVHKFRKITNKTKSSTIPYSNKHMKRKLLEYFGDEIMITEINGTPNIVTSRSTASSILYSHYKETKHGSEESEKIRVIETAAKLIKNDIKCANTSPDTYPSSLDIELVRALKYLPETLTVFLKHSVTGKNVDLKLAALGQCLMQAARPRVLLPPLQISLGIQLHHQFGSRVLIDTLHKLGYCSQYAIIKDFEKCAAVHTPEQTLPEDTHSTDTQFVQYAADNVDHNSRTLDGLNTFHGMGMISMATPRIPKYTHVPKRKVSMDEILQISKVDIKFCSKFSKMSNTAYKAIRETTPQDPTMHLNLLWKASMLLQPPWSAWSGFMQTVHQGEYPGMTDVGFLPLINLNPSDMSCIYSTLLFLKEEASKHNATPIVTFDQPLWYKARLILMNKPEIGPVVLRLGGLHTQMSFLGSIGHLMDGTGLRELLELIYAPNAVSHILTGAAISRATRGHILVTSVLHTILMKEVMTDSEVSYMKLLYHDLLTSVKLTEDVCADDIFKTVTEKLNAERLKMSNMRTAKLWLMYVDMVDILLQFLKAERTGNWELHLHSLRMMLPYLAASGHHHYTKSVRMYLQDMENLEELHPDIHNKFIDGNHVVRRSDRYWAGLSTDLTIEQVLMRSLKTKGGLTRGRGMTETQCALWVLSMPQCAEINEAMQKLTSMTPDEGRSHVDMSTARRKDDTRDINKLEKFLTDMNPFNENSSLCNIYTGVSATSNVNVDEAKRIGCEILDSMTDLKPDDYVFKRNKTCVTLATKMKTTNENTISVDPLLMFQRLLTVATTSCELDLNSVLSYELSTYPASIFDDFGVLREADKAELAKALGKMLENPDETLPDKKRFVIDGGSMLQKIPWNVGETYEDICERYGTYIECNYGDNSVVVFDGYEYTYSTKDQTHNRRGKGKVGPLVTFTEKMILSLKKDAFLSNSKNKQNFINMLSEKLRAKAITTIHSASDADVLIVQTAVEYSMTESVVVIGEDTDLLILLCYHTKLDSNPVYMAPQLKRNVPQRVWNIHTLQRKLGPDLCKRMLFLHALFGCDTTSRLYGITKSAFIHNAEKYFTSADVFANPTSTQKDIFQFGEKALAIAYRGKDGETLNEIRLNKFCSKVSSAKVHTGIQPKTLPPTSNAAKYHSYRVYHQTQHWMGVEKDATEWGWEIIDGQLKPITMDEKPAPDALLQVLHCGCKEDCSSKLCTCKKYAIACSNACTNCRGISCCNAQTIINDADDFDEIDE